MAAMRATILCALLMFSLPAFCNGTAKGFESIYPKLCKDGLHRQPKGQFGVYVFCDDAQGTNIAVVHLYPGDSEFEKWPIARRFWQGEPWALDVSSIGWVPNKNLLVVATSEIYGEGNVFLLDLESQESTVLLSPKDCGASITAISESSVTVALHDCVNEKPYKRVVLKLPSFNPMLKKDSAKRAAP
jgi:hypothetical protein